ncbi:MAG: hypothetical protein NTU98_01865 [Bacteroidetes bacterium]|nr:hypothetical protein [Bacteroidota bacterium]
MKRFFVVSFLFLLLLAACAKKDAVKLSDSIQIVSLTASLNPVKAWDTTVITVVATGDSLQYGWKANHGNFTGGGKQIRYAAGECCVGLNTITCRVFNNTGEVSDTVMIRVTSYIHPKKK